MYIEHSNFRAPASPVVPASLFIAAYSLTVLRLLRHLMNYSMQEIFVQLCGRYGGFYIKHTYSVTLCNNIIIWTISNKYNQTIDLGSAKTRFAWHTTEFNSFTIPNIAKPLDSRKSNLQSYHETRRNFRTIYYDNKIISFHPTFLALWSRIMDLI